MSHFHPFSFCIRIDFTFSNCIVNELFDSFFTFCFFSIFVTFQFVLDSCQFVLNIGKLRIQSFFLNFQSIVWSLNFCCLVFRIFQCVNSGNNSWNFRGFLQTKLGAYRTKCKFLFFVHCFLWIWIFYLILIRNRTGIIKWFKIAQFCIDRSHDFLKGVRFHYSFNLIFYFITNLFRGF